MTAPRDDVPTDPQSGSDSDPGGTTATAAADAATEDAHVLLLTMRTLQVQANRAEMARARVMVRLYQHFASDVEARRAADPYFTAPPMTETVTETQPVTGQSTGRIRSDIQVVLTADEHLPWLAALLDAGKIELYRAKPVTDAINDDLTDDPEARRRFSELMERWFTQAATASPELLNKTITQIRNRVHYVVAKLLKHEFDRRFKKRYGGRNVNSYPTGDGMAALNVETDEVSVKLAHHHLDLLARDARAGGDPRTLEQLRADLAIDLLTGKQAASGFTGRWARPVINITVPITTVMGLSDDPGLMGERPLPASLVRHVAQQPGSTWYRMLTDPARRCAELSTTAYRPTAAIWREVVAAQPTCFAPTCSRPAVECELDHRVPYPDGPTSTSNLGPGCPRDHHAKHAAGARLERGQDGVLRYTTRSGMTHVVAPAEQPVVEGDAGAVWRQLLEAEPDCRELLEALESVRHHQAIVLDTEQEALVQGRTWARYRRDYPDVPDEEIDDWVWGAGSPPAPRLASVR